MVYRVYILFWALFAVPSLGISCGRKVALEGSAPMTSSIDGREALLRHVLYPVLKEGDRERFFDGGPAELKRIHGGVQIETPVGRYSIRFTKDAEARYPREGLPELEWHDGKVLGEVTLSEEVFRRTLPRLRGAVRSLFRADPYLHPQLPAPDLDEKAPFTATYPQLQAIQELLAMEASSPEYHRRGLILPVGTGKTVTAAKYVKSLWEYHQQLGTAGWEKPPRVVYVMENEIILDDAIKTFERELGFKKIGRFYGDVVRVYAPVDPSTELTAISRTTLNLRVRELLSGLLESGEPCVFIVDEGQQAGKEDGQFESILGEVGGVLGPNRRLLYMSATLWHGDKHIIRDELKGQVVAPLLSRSELEKLRAGEHLAHLSLNQFFRFVEAGYLAPLYGVHVVPKLPDGQSAAPFLERPRGRDLPLPVSLLEEVNRRIRESAIAGQPDKAVFFAPSRAQATDYARYLQPALGYPVEPFHRGIAKSKSVWERFIEREGEAGLTTVDLLRHGVDFPPLNLSVHLHSYGKNRGGFRRFLQELGRIMRVSEGKFYARFIDFSGVSRRLLGGLTRISVEAHSNESEGSETRPWHFNGADLSKWEFEREVLRLFPGPGAFSYEYPHFDSQVFIAGGFFEIQKRFAEYGIPSVRHPYWPKDFAIQLASYLQDSDEKWALIEALYNDEDRWDWQASDGSLIGDPSRAQGQRFYSALYAVAVLFKREGHEVDLAALHTQEGMAAFLDALVPWKGSLTDEAEIQAFLAPGGDYEAFFQSAALFGVTNITTVEGIRDLAVAIHRGVPIAEGDILSERIIAQIDSIDYWQWKTQDNMGRRSTADLGRAAELREPRQGYQRVYRVLKALRWRLRNHPELALLSTTDLLRKLAPEQIDTASITPEDIRAYRDQGGHEAVSHRVSWFERTRVQSPFFTHHVVETLARLSKAKEKEGALERIDHIPWKKTDGNMLMRENPDALNRFLAGLREAMALHHWKWNKGSAFSGEALGAFFDQVFLGMVIGEPTPEQLHAFTLPNGGMGLLQSLTGVIPDTENWRGPWVPSKLVKWIARQRELDAQSYAILGREKI
ncbi:DEAD/DEAH box helicase family protein [bacterium]|nr:DEAD/DEAH box helicase family protein [bacterium]